MHRSIKRTVGRTNKSVEEAVFWHNNSASPLNLVPFEVIFGVKSKKPGISKDRRPVTRSVVETPTEIDGKSFSYKNPFLVGDKVYLRDKTGRCDIPWSGPHVVTKIYSPCSVNLDDESVVRHISHLKLSLKSRHIDLEESYFKSDNVNLEPQETNKKPRRSARVKKPPCWLKDYVR